MKSHNEHQSRMDLLRELMERLDAPDLTLVEAKGLRSRLNSLLEHEDSEDGPTRDAGARHGSSPSVGLEEWEDALRPDVYSLCGVG